MRVVLTSDCDVAWVRSLTPWQLATLAATYRQGRHLPDRTNSGSDNRWRQAGCKTRDSFGVWHRKRPDDGHERVVVRRTDYGYELTGIRRKTVWLINPETGETSATEGWVPVWTWYVSAQMSANFPLDSDAFPLDPDLAKRLRQRRAAA